MTWFTPVSYLVAIYSLFHASWLTFIIGCAISSHNFNKNSEVSINKRQDEQMAAFYAEQRKRLEEAGKKQNQEYQSILQTELREHRQKADELRQSISQAYARQQANSAEGQYRSALSKIEEQRRAIRDIDRIEQEKLQAVIESHRQPLLEQHLSKYVLKPGLIPGVGPALIATLNQKGVYTAKDINTNVRWIKGVGPKRQQDLLEWRETLEQFFQFNPSLVPSREFEAVYTEMDSNRKSKLSQLGQAITKLGNDLTSWKKIDESIAIDIRDLKTKLLQHEKAIEMIEEEKQHSI